MTLQHHFRCAIGCRGQHLVALLILSCALQAWAVTPDSWKAMSYSHRQPTSTSGQMLTAFAQAMGLRLEASTGIPLGQSVQIDSVAQSPVQFLDRIGFMLGWSWYVHAGVLHVSPATAEHKERITLGALSAATAQQALIGAGIFEAKFGWGELDEPQPVVIVGGPPSYRELVRQAISKSKSASASNEPDIMVFPLKHASAADTEIQVRDRQMIRAGVATLLRQLMGSTRDRPVGEDSRAPGPVAMSRMATPDQGVPGLSGVPGMPARSAWTGPTIDVYAPLNAVVVRDLPDKRKRYEALVETLDVPARKVEIVATILDVDVGTLRQWSAGVSLGGDKLTLTGQAAAQMLGDSAQANAASVDPAVVLFAQDKLSLRIRNLESEGHAQVQSRPSVLTLDNHSAVLDLSQSAYFKVVGERSADLKSVTVGTMLRVTPRIMGKEDGASIRIDVDVEDGNLLNTNALTEPPQATRSLITTQSIVRPNEALVIGGYQREDRTTSLSQVPWFGSLPLIGRLFQSDLKGQRRRERLFVLTARQLPDALPSADGAAIPSPVTPWP